MPYVLMAYVVMPHVVTAYVVVTACLVTADAVTACLVMGYVVMAVSAAVAASTSLLLPADRVQVSHHPGISSLCKYQNAGSALPIRRSSPRLSPAILVISKM